MFMRLLQLRVKTQFLEAFRRFYEDTIIPALQKTPGCQFAGLMQSHPHPDECISLTFWDTQSNAEAFDKSETFQGLLQKAKPFLSESTEWKIQLSENFELEYKPVPEEPLLKEYVVAAQTEEAPPLSPQNARIHVRIVSAKIQEDKLEEFKQLYSTEVIPALQTTKGCSYAYLTENLQEENEFISVTIWDSQEDAESYEKNGRFAELLDKTKHTFSQPYQWKLGLEQGFRGQVVTSEDLSVTHYSLVTGKNLQ